MTVLHSLAFVHDRGSCFGDLVFTFNAFCYFQHCFFGCIFQYFVKLKGSGECFIFLRYNYGSNCLFQRLKMEIISEYPSRYLSLLII